MDAITKNWTVISLGGSMIYPKDQDAEYVAKFVDLIKHKTGASNFAIITGGGFLARKYQQALREANAAVTNDELDTVGIKATRENAEYVKTIFGDVAEPEIFFDPNDLKLSGKTVLVGGGWKPGRSSDDSAVAVAKALGAHKLINLSNIDYVYTADPRKDPNAVKIEKTNWADFRKLLPETWDPGANVPFDPIAAKVAEEIGLEVAVMNGKNIENIGAYLDGKEFVGTVIA
jgi:uridylate kinase